MFLRSNNKKSTGCWKCANSKLRSVYKFVSVYIFFFIHSPRSGCTNIYRLMHSSNNNQNQLSCLFLNINRAQLIQLHWSSFALQYRIHSRNTREDIPNLTFLRPSEFVTIWYKSLSISILLLYFVVFEFFFIIIIVFFKRFCFFLFRFCLYLFSSKRFFFMIPFWYNTFFVANFRCYCFNVFLFFYLEICD